MQFASLGALFRSSRAAELTESETEYVVTATKHVFPDHLVLDFAVTNTLPEQQLSNVRVAVELEQEEEVRVQAAGRSNERTNERIVSRVYFLSMRPLFLLESWLY